MQFSTKNKVIIAVVVVMTTFALGRYSVNQTPAVRNIADSKTNKDINKDKDTHTITTITKKPDGTITETIDKTTETKSQEKDQIVSHVDQTITPPKQSKLNISVLGASDFSRGLLIPTYGLSVSKEVLGPVTIGAFGLMNGVVGISIGLDF